VNVIVAIAPGRVAALTLAGAFAILAVRSAIHWIRHRPPLRDTADELLFAAFVTGRVGTWTTAAAMFTVFGTISAFAYVDEARSFSWLFIVFIALGAMQFLAAWFLGLRDRAHGNTGHDPRRPEP
jgi:hypothetical protein